MLVEAQQFGESLWGKTAKLVVKLPDGTLEDYFLKACCFARSKTPTPEMGLIAVALRLQVVPKLDNIGKQMCHGEFESLKAIDKVSPGFVPKPYGWGKIASGEGSYFLLVEFRHIGRQVGYDAVLFSQIQGLGGCDLY